MNPIIEKSKLPFGAIPFHSIESSHFLPALENTIDHCREIISGIEKNDPSFKNTVEELERSGRILGETSSIFFNIHSAETNDEIEKIAGEYSQRITEFHNEIALNENLFNRVKQTFENCQKNELTSEQYMLLNKTFKSFIRNGALLDSEAKEELKSLDKELSSLKIQFGQNVLGETNSYVLIVDTIEELSGIPEDVISTAKELATEKGSPEKWAFSLQMPSYLPVVTYAENRKLREELFRAFNSRCCKGGEFDNKEICIKIAQLRKKRAQLLGYNTHAEYVLEERMAKKPNEVTSFLEELLEKSLDVAKEQVNEVSVFAAENGAELPLQRWDFPYWAEKLKKEKYSIDNEMLKPYFVLENVLEGAFSMANKLYGLTFKENKGIPTYHEEVRVFEVYEENGNFLSLFYADFFPRSGKRAGAWMTSFKNQFVESDEDHRPHISIVCNFNRPTATKPSLLTFNEVTTLFHEFGHALHGMCAKGQYSKLSGTNVYWDFVELPSQLHENWCYEQECLNLFATHYETGDVIPMELVKKLEESAKFLEGSQTVRQVSFGLLDMAWHHNLPDEITDIFNFERTILERTSLLPGFGNSCMSTAFQHIFNGGYSAGYYSYKWAEVLDADAFEAFKQNGIFNRITGQSFKENILEKGGTEDPAKLYEQFRGQKPSQKALLNRAGLA